MIGSFPVHDPLEACSEVKGRLVNKSLVAWGDECYVGGSGWALGEQWVHSAFQLTSGSGELHELLGRYVCPPTNVAHFVGVAPLKP